MIFITMTCIFALIFLYGFLNHIAYGFSRRLTLAINKNVVTVQKLSALIDLFLNHFYQVNLIISRRIGEK